MARATDHLVIVSGTIFYSLNVRVGQAKTWKLRAMDVRGIFFFFQAEDGIRDYKVTGVQTCALPISVLALTPGFLRSEVMLDQFGVAEANWREAAKKDPNFEESETPLFSGRAVAAQIGRASCRERG